MVVWKQEKQYYNTAILGASSSVFSNRFVSLVVLCVIYSCLSLMS